MDWFLKCASAFLAIDFKIKGANKRIKYLKIEYTKIKIRIVFSKPIIDALANRPHFRPWLAGVLFERPPPPRAERRQWRGDFTASDLKNDATAALGRRQQGLDVDLELHALQGHRERSGEQR